MISTMVHIAYRAAERSIAPQGRLAKGRVTRPLPFGKRCRTMQWKRGLGQKKGGEACR